MRHRRSSVPLLAAIVCAASAPPAPALEPGVHANPGSPAGIEYAFPLGSARTELSGPSPGPSAPSAPLFGVGIKPGAVGTATGAQRVRTGRPRAKAGSARGGGGRSRAQARRLERISLAGSLGDLAVLLTGGVLLAGVLAGSLGLSIRRHVSH